MKEVEVLFIKSNYNIPNFTIRDILSNHTPLIVFSDYANPKSNHLIEGLFNTKNYKESKYDLSEYQGCENRGELSRAKYHKKYYNGQQVNLFLLNHFYKTSFNFIPGTDTYQNINNYHSIHERSIKCQK